MFGLFNNNLNLSQLGSNPQAAFGAIQERLNSLDKPWASRMSEHLGNMFSNLPSDWSQFQMPQFPQQQSSGGFPHFGQMPVMQPMGSPITPTMAPTNNPGHDYQTYAATPPQMPQLPPMAGMPANRRPAGLM